MNASDYDLRSLQHERRMLDLYRIGAPTDGGLLQPLANACWRAAGFEWRLHEDAVAVRRLWEEAARALADGFARKRSGLERTPDQLMLALHFSIASQTPEVSQALVHVTLGTSATDRATRFSRASLLLVEGYQLLVRCVLEGKTEHARSAQNSLAEAHEWDVGFEPELALATETGWRIREHEATRALAAVIAGVLGHELDQQPFGRAPAEAAVLEFGSLIETTLLYLEQYIEAEVNHRPKLYCWLPGIALTVLAANAGVPMQRLDPRRELHPGSFERLPHNLIQPAGLRHATHT